MATVAFPKPTYLIPFVAGFANWSAEQWATSQEWFHGLPFGMIWWLCLAFLAGLVVQDTYNPDSWIRRNLRLWRASIVLDDVNHAHSSTNSIESVRLTARLRFIRDTKASVTVKVVELLGRPSERVFVLHGPWEDENNYRADAILKLELANIPVKAYQGKALPPAAWTSHPNRSHGGGTIIGGTNSLIEITAYTARGSQTVRAMLICPHTECYEFGKPVLQSGKDHVTIRPYND